MLSTRKWLGALSLFSIVAANQARAIEVGLNAAQCDGSFPEAPPTSTRGHYDHNRLLVAIPGDSTFRSYAPLCPDGRHIDIRQLQSCNAGSCWNPAYNSCTFECTWNQKVDTNPPTPQPTSEPTIRLEDTTHSVRLTFKNVPDDFRISDEVRATILRFVVTTLKETLGDGLTFVDAVFATKSDTFANGGNPRNLRSAERTLLYTLYLPLRVTVRGPSDVSDFALSFVMQSMRDLMPDLANYLISMEGDQFVGFDFSSIGAEDYDESELDNMLQDRDPVPTQAVTSSVVQSKGEPVEEDGNSTWWIWLIVALILIAVCICVVAVCMRRNKEEEKNATTKKIYNVNQNYNRDAKRHNQPPPPRGKGSVAGYSRRSAEDSRRSAGHSRRRDDDSRRSADYSRRTEKSRKPQVKPSKDDYEKELELEEARQQKMQEDQLVMYNEESVADDSQMPPSDDVSLVTEVESAMPVGIDPPEENYAMVMYDPNSNAQNSNALVLYDTNSEPKGEKHPKMMSMYADEVYSNINRQEPQGLKDPKSKSYYAESHVSSTHSNATDPPYETYSTQRSSKKSKKSKKSSKRRGVGENLKRSFSRKKTPIQDIDEESFDDSIPEDQTFATQEPPQNNTYEQPYSSESPQSKPSRFRSFTRHMSWISGDVSSKGGSYYEE